MPDLVLLVFPIFALIALGYGVVVTGLLPQNMGQVLSRFVFTVPLPLLIFRSLATRGDVSQTPWSLWLAYFSCVLIVWICGMLAVRWFFGRQGSVLAVAGVSAGFSNLVMLGIPIVSAVFGEAGLVPLFLLLTVHLPIMMTASFVLVEWYGREDGGKIRWGALVGKIVRGLVTNPIIIGIVSGGVWGLFGWPMPQLASVFLDAVAPAAVPTALIALGMGLRDYGLRGNVWPGFALALLKLILFPALFYFLALHVFEFSPLWTAAIVLAAACPTGVNAYLLANHFGVGHGIAANTITLSVLLGLVTLPFWIGIVVPMVR